MADKKSFIIFKRDTGPIYYLVDIKKEKNIKDCDKIVWTTDQEEALEFATEDEAEEFIWDYAHSLDREEVDISTTLDERPYQYSLVV